jgi:dGTPase
LNRLGHSGKPLRVSIGNGQKYKDQLTAKEWQDLIDFEGMLMVFQYLPQADQE